MWNKWILYNASMILASRCNKVFSKNFIFNVTKDPFSIKACLSAEDINDLDSSQSIEIQCMLSIECKYLPSLIVRFSGFGLEEYEMEALKQLGYILGKGITRQFHIAKNFGTEIIFDLDPNLNYEKYEIQLDYLSHGEKKTINTTFPLAKYLNTEFELELMLTFNNDESSVLNISRNGNAVFDDNTFIAKSSWGIIRIQKDDNTYKIILRNIRTSYDWCCNNKKSTDSCVGDRSNDNYLDAGIFYSHILSYIGQLTILGTTPCLPQLADKDPFMDIYISADNIYVSIDRIRNYGLTQNDIKAAIPELIKKLGGSRMDIDWSREIFLAFLP